MLEEDRTVTMRIVTAKCQIVYEPLMTGGLKLSFTGSWC